MSVIRLPALRAVQHGHVMFQVNIPAAKLRKLNLKVERFDSSFVEQFRRGDITKEEYLERQGYQRIVDNNRANKFAAYLQDDTAISPTVILLNDRDGSCTYD